MGRTKKISLAALLMVVFIAAAGWAYNCWHNPPQPVYIPQTQAETPHGVQEAADKAGVHISPGQAKEVAQAIHEATARPPDTVIQTTGAGMPQALARVQQGAQLQIVTDPAKPDQKPDKPAADQPVNLNVYNIKAHPRQLLEVTAYQRAGDIAYVTRVQVFGTTSYLGPVVSYDGDRAGSKIRIGVRLSVPLD